MTQSELRLAGHSSAPKFRPKPSLAFPNRQSARGTQAWERAGLAGRVASVNATAFGPSRWRGGRYA
jgi:hypothetical protein